MQQSGQCLQIKRFKLKFKKYIDINMQIEMRHVSNSQSFWIGIAQWMLFLLFFSSISFTLQTDSFLRSLMWFFKQNESVETINTR